MPDEDLPYMMLKPPELSSTATTLPVDGLGDKGKEGQGEAKRRVLPKHFQSVVAKL